MTTKTRDEIVEQAARFNKLVGAGQSLEAEDSAAIDAHFEPLVAQLNVDEICDVANEDEIPSEWFVALAGLLANASGPEFGIEYNPQKKQVLEAELVRMNSSGPTRETLQVDYF